MNQPKPTRPGETTPMSQSSQINYLPWIAVAVLGYMLWSQQAKVDPKPIDPVAVSPSKTLDSCYLADRSSKLEVLKGIAAVKDATDEQKLQQLNEQSESRRVKDFQPYIDIVSDALFSEKLDELISKLQAKK